MNRKALSLSAVSIVAALTALPAWAQDRVVNVYNWSDYIDSTIIDEFTKETGIKVVYDTYDSNEVLETKLLAGGSGYDIVVPTASPFLARQIAAGVYQKLDKSKLPNLANMWDVVSKRMEVFDPGNEYSVNYMWGTTGMGFNIKKVKEALGIDKIDSWDVFFKPENIAKLKDCGVYVLDSPTDIIPTALNYLGLDPEFVGAGRSGEGGGASPEHPSVHPQIPFVGIHQRARQWRHLSGRRLLRRSVPGARPRGGSQSGRRDRLLHPQGRRGDVVRSDGYPGRRAACRRGA